VTAANLAQITVHRAPMDKNKNLIAFGHDDEDENYFFPPEIFALLPTSAAGSAVGARVSVMWEAPNRVGLPRLVTALHSVASAPEGVETAKRDAWNAAVEACSAATADEFDVWGYSEGIRADVLRAINKQVKA
jgi:hypothetical protein